jgi:hypothetical protein
MGTLIMFIAATLGNASPDAIKVGGETVSYQFRTKAPTRKAHNAWDKLNLDHDVNPLPLKIKQGPLVRL